MPLEWPEFHLCNYEAFFLPQYLYLHYKICCCHICHRILQHLISAAAVFSTDTLSHTESYSLSYYPAQILFSHHIIHIICTTPSVTCTIQVLPLMSPSSRQCDCLTFSLIYALHCCCIHYLDSSSFIRLKLSPSILFYCSPIPTCIYCPSHNILPPSSFLIVHIRLIFFSIYCVHQSPPSLCSPQANVVH